MTGKCQLAGINYNTGVIIPGNKTYSDQKRIMRKIRRTVRITVVLATRTLVLASTMYCTTSSTADLGAFAHWSLADLAENHSFHVLANWFSRLH